MNKIHSAIESNRRGIAYFGRGEFEKAIDAYRAAIDARPDYIDAYYNLGLALTKAGRREDALNVYESLLALSPQHLGARFQLGCLWMQRREDKKAIEHFSVIEQHYPEHHETLVNLGACYLRLSYLNEAKSRYVKAYQLDPHDLQVLFNLGVINGLQGRLKEAETFYIEALKIDPHFHDAHHNLGVIYLALGDSEAALLHFRAALRIQPDNEAVRHSINILSHQKNLSASPPEYIRSLFDSYAGHYDEHLIRVLHYEVPQHLFEMVQLFCQHKKIKMPPQWDILDLGSGTGLAGALFKPYSRQLTGVDLSGKMLSQAAQKRIYDDLIEADILTFLHDKITCYDLIIAGDVLVYFGDLDRVIAAIAASLKPGGLFVFNLEIGEDKDYCMTDSGRFVHRRSYVDQLLEKHQLQLRQYNSTKMRIQDGKNVQGHFYLVQR